MKKINKKGFTLVELLAVVVILLAISVIAISSISAAIDRNNVKRDEATKKMIVSYAKLYVDEYANTFTGSCVNVSTLVTAYNIDEETLAKASSSGSFTSGSVSVSDTSFTYQDTGC